MKRAKNALKKAEKLLTFLQVQERKTKAEIKRLEKLGATAGTIHNQEKRPGYNVAYLNHANSETGGKRIREYIGACPECVKGNKQKVREAENRIKSAQARINRAEKIRVLNLDLRNIERAISVYSTLLNSACSQCDSISKGQRTCGW